MFSYIFEYSQKFSYLLVYNTHIPAFSPSTCIQSIYIMTRENTLQFPINVSKIHNTNLPNVKLLRGKSDKIMLLLRKLIICIFSTEMGR